MGPTSSYNEALRIDASYVDAYGRRAWLRATCPDSRFRDGQLALEDATTTYELTQRKEGLSHLAAAHAELENFEQAVDWLTRAIKLDPERSKEVRQLRLKHYRAGQPWREERVSP